MPPVPRTILRATAVAATLDLLSAFVFSGMKGRTPAQVLRGVASGPFGDGMREAGAGAALIGLCIHVALMTLFVSLFVLAARRLPGLRARPVAAGLGYGVLLYLVMYWIVLPARWPAIFPQLGWWPVGNALFSHCICVGLPIALIARAGLRRRGFA